MEINIENGNLQIYAVDGDIFIRKYSHSDTEPVELMLTKQEFSALLPMIQYVHWEY